MAVAAGSGLLDTGRGLLCARTNRDLRHDQLRFGLLGDRLWRFLALVGRVVFECDVLRCVVSDGSEGCCDADGDEESDYEGLDLVGLLHFALPPVRIICYQGKFPRCKVFSLTLLKGLILRNRARSTNAKNS